MRFRKLMGARDWDTMYRQSRTAIKILKGDVQASSLLYYVIAWDNYFKDVFQESNGLKVMLAEKYFKGIEL